MSTKVALITGASRGLGRSIALHLAADGVDVIGTFRGERDEADEVAAGIDARGSRAAMLRLDLADASTFPDFASRVRTILSDTFGRYDLDVLVNNAGIGGNTLLADLDADLLDRVFTINVKGPMLLTRHLLPLIADGGRILNVSSSLTRMTLPSYGLYAATKGAMEQMTSYLALELRDRRIRVNTIAPGAVASDFNGGSVRDDPEIGERVVAATALGRAGYSDDIGGAVAAILSDRCGWLTGTRIEVSGGYAL